MPLKPQPFNDGIVAIYGISSTADPGEAPVDKLTFKESLRFNRRTVGVQRQYLAMQVNARIDYLLRCPYRRDVSTFDVAIPTLDGQQYRITAVQVPEDIQPPVMDLTLEKLEAYYGLS